MLPNFLVIGAMKAGTDSLWEYLRSSPHVYMSETKELDYFTAELNWSRGGEWYQRQFQGAGEAVAVGEASSSYAKHPVYQGVPSRMARVLPDVRLIYLIRHPVDRICSQYLHQSLLGEERDPIERAVLENPAYVDFSRYAMQVERYLECFPRERLLLVSSERLRDDREATMRRILGFLGVDRETSSAVLDREFHSTAEKRVLRSFFASAHRVPGYDAVARHVPRFVKESTHLLRTRGIDSDRAILPDGIRSELEDRLRQDVERLRAYLREDFDGWGIG